MMDRLKHICLLLLLLLSIRGLVYGQKPNNIITANDHVILLLDLNSPETTLDSLLKTAGIDNPDLKTIKKRNYTALQKTGWNVVLLAGNRLHMDRSLSGLKAGKVFMATSQPFQNEGRPGYPAEVLYGVNNFARITVRDLDNGYTRFFVPGNFGARRVILSGNFNSWSTLQGQMLKTDSGWIKDIKIEPGIYEYKFIINGNWIHDTNNNLKVDDGYDGYNSVYYRYNFSFKLPGFGNANRVVVTGSFNKWNPGQLIMDRAGNGWELKLYLHDGIHQYHFLVDGKVVTDPANQSKNKNDAGNQSSVLNLGQTIYFRLGGYEHAQRVSVAGNFNHWKPDELMMKNINGVWTLPYTLASGNYQYKFIVDGQWMRDPTNPNTGTEGGETNSFISVGPNHIFHLRGYGNAKRVILSGSFNNWNEDGYVMEHQGDEWIINLRLKQGKYLYKFIIDGKWIIDPGNQLWEQNEFDTGNSVLWIE